MDKKALVKQLEALVAEIAANNGCDVGLARGLLGMIITKYSETIKADCKVG